jgi:hypothetical protein
VSSRDFDRSLALLLVAIATAVGAAFRFYSLGWGAPYFHFHMDEHYVFMGADLLRRSPESAAMSPKFFMYSPGPMYVVNAIRAAYESVVAPLDLTRQQDQVTYMLLGRAFSATLGTLTIPLVYLIASRVASRMAGVIAAVLLACSVIHLRDSHFFTVDISLTFFSALAWYFLIRVVQRGDRRFEIGAGIAFGLAVVSKYTAVFLAPLVLLAELLSPASPRTVRPLAAWVRPLLRTAAIGVLAVATFFILDPLVLQYFDKFMLDVREQIAAPHLTGTTAMYAAHFVGIRPRLFWFTNLLWWSVGPVLEVASIAAIAWLVVRRDRLALITAAFPIVYWLVAGQSPAPFVRYVLPLTPALAVVTGVAFSDWLQLANVALRRLAAAGAAVVLTSTALWALAYMNIFWTPDARLTASRWLMQNVPANAAVLVEPTHNTPPMGSYVTNVDFYGDHVIWGAFDHPRGEAERHDYYRLYALDTYRYLYDRTLTDEDRRQYIDRRLAAVDWIVMDDTYTQWYEALDAEEYSVVKEYYRDLFAGRRGFELVRTFKVYPSLFGRDINDDSAELSFRLFDHPRVYIFRRHAAAQ